ncbi:hypothetical protein PDK11_20465 [Bacillus cereus]|nr:hypothetical protein [Bacillus cereus]
MNKETQGDKWMRRLATGCMIAFGIIYIVILSFGLNELIGGDVISNWILVWGAPIVVLILVIVVFGVHLANYKYHKLFHIGIYIKFLETLLTLVGGIYLTKFDQPLWLFSLSLFVTSILKGISWVLHFKAFMNKSKNKILKEEYVNQL